MLQFKHEGKSCNFDKDSITLHEVIKALGLDSKKLLAVKFNGEAMDLSSIVTSDGEVSPITADSPEGLEIIRHSSMTRQILQKY